MPIPSRLPVYTFIISLLLLTKFHLNVYKVIIVNLTMARKTLIGYIFEGGIRGKHFIASSMSRRGRTVYQITHKVKSRFDKNYFNAKIVGSSIQDYISLHEHYKDREATSTDIKKFRAEEAERHRTGNYD